MKTPCYTVRNVVGLMQTLMDKRDNYHALRKDPHSLLEDRDEAFADLIRTENDLVEALAEVLKQRS